MFTFEGGRLIGYCPFCGTRMHALVNEPDHYEGLCPACAHSGTEEHNTVTIFKVSRSGKTVTLGVVVEEEEE